MSEGVNVLVVLFAASLCSSVSEQHGVKAFITTPISFVWITHKHSHTHTHTHIKLHNEDYHSLALKS